MEDDSVFVRPYDRKAPPRVRKPQRRQVTPVEVDATELPRLVRKARKRRRGRRHMSHRKWNKFLAALRARRRRARLEQD
jgi:hypothetical protein